MTLELLICTIDERMQRIESHLLPQRADVSYLISWQYTGLKPAIPEWAASREDVRVVLLEGWGLSRNRNNALVHAQGDILKICDDDETWDYGYFDKILDTYQQHPEYDVVHFQIDGIDKEYPNPSVASCEITMRRQSVGKMRFDERFGLGSEQLMSGEEDVFLYDAHKMGLSICYEPCVVCEIHGITTGDRYWEPRVLRSKGAVFYYTRGLSYAIYKSVRESLGRMVRQHMNPFFTLRHMLWGIRYIRSCRQ